MSVVVIGCDDVSAVRRMAAQHGFDRVHHRDRRGPRDVHRPLPRDARVVLIVVDSVNHNLVHKVKRDARISRIPVIYAGRSLGDVTRTLAAFGAREWAARRPVVPAVDPLRAGQLPSSLPRAAG